MVGDIEIGNDITERGCVKGKINALPLITSTSIKVRYACINQLLKHAVVVKFTEFILKES